MLTASTNYKNTLKKGVNLQAQARLIAEWNMNRFAGPPTVTNTGVTDGDSEEFPIESIVEPNRPIKDGIQKARVVSNARWLASGKSLTAGNVSAMYNDVKQSATALQTKKGYVASAQSKYKYWSSSTTSGTTLASGGYAISNASLEVMYWNEFWSNKIVVNFEATAAAPKDVVISYKETSGGSWITIPGTYQIDGEGKIVIYRQANDTWSTTEYNYNPIKIRAIRVVVPRMSRASSYLNVIEISARLQADLSEYLIDYSVTNSLSEASLVTPLGTCSSNEANVNLSNVDGRFDTNRLYLTGTLIPNLFWNIIDKGIQMRLDLGLMVNGSMEWTRQFTMWTDEWGDVGQETSTVSLKDSSKVLQEAKPNNTLYRGLSTAGIVWRMCDGIGFNNYSIPAAALNDNSIIKYYWTDSEQTVWDHFVAISQATQTAIYFDEFDNLKVLSRASAYDTSKITNPSWVFDYETVPTNAAGRDSSDYGKLPDIVETTQKYDFEANTVNVKYTPTEVSQSKGSVQVMEQAWAPEGDVVLRASRLNTSMLSSNGFFRITPTEAKIWPYSGVVQIEGEFIRYKSKGYSYRLANGTWTAAYIASEEERLKLDALSPNYAFANYFNGNFNCSGGRGLWGTFSGNHYVDLAGWTMNRYRTGGGSVRTSSALRIHDKRLGKLKIATNKTFTPNTWFVTTKGASGDQAPIWYGTRIRFPSSGYTRGHAGLAFNVGTNDSGYFVELNRTSSISATDRAKYTHELCFYVRYTNGSIKRFGPNGGKGIPIQIVPGQDYDLDVKFEQGSTRIISIMVNGVVRMTVPLTIAQGTGEAIGGRYGFFARGFTHAEFEYLYSSTTPINDAFDQEGWFDRIRGGFQSSQYDREWTYQWKTAYKIRNKKIAKVQTRYASRMMDEFGPVVHEVREYDVDFEKKPMIHSNLYISNDAQIICPEYIGTPFGASFVLANTSRVNAVANGEDTLTFGVDNPVDQRMLIYGRLVTQEESQSVTVKNDTAINRRGIVEVDIESEWIQTKTTAQAIGDWISKHWGGGCDEITIESIGNPLLQLGDVVAVNDPTKAMTFATHRYFVISIEHSFDGGLVSTFTLRRARA